MLMLFTAVIASIVAILVVVGLIELANSHVGEQAAVVVGIVAGVLAFVGVLAIVVATSPKRHIYFYRDALKKEKVLEVQQDQKMQIVIATYTVLDPAGGRIAAFRKNYLYNLFRKRWECLAPDGSAQFTAIEDSLILSLLRRLLGSFFGLLRTNFILLDGDGGSETIVGEFNRRFTLFDRYVLDLTKDPTRKLDRRLAVAMGVLLDTGERR